jgi:phosphatidate cytidylyltransferase
MKSFVQRTLTTVIGVPVIFVLIYCLPQCNHLAFAILVYAASLLGSYELKTMLDKSEATHTSLPFWAPSLLIVAAWVETYYEHLPLTDFSLLILALVSFSTEIINKGRDDFRFSLSHTSASALLLLYPSFFFTFLIKVSDLQDSIYLLLLFFLLVFGNDTFAYLFGVAFGKNNRGVLKVSPNKSIAGFVGGTLSTVVLSMLYCHFIKIGINIWQSLLLGLAISFSANVGDLIESSFKRAAGMKDSGTIVPGRGGILDSIDSLVASAPFFWVLCIFFIK